MLYLHMTDYILIQEREFEKALELLSSHFKFPLTKPKAVGT